MKVRYTGSWSNFSAEKEETRKLIDEGCVIIAQHVNTMAPAIVCEEASAAGKTVYHVGYHQGMMDVAPSCALVSIRTNWSPYVLEAVQAVMNKQNIEKSVKANVHGRDLSAGFESGWVELLDLNDTIAAYGSQEKAEKAIDSLKKGKTKVFYGNYTGVNPRNSSDTIDLNTEFIENQNSSNPSFSYILDRVIQVEN